MVWGRSGEPALASERPGAGARAPAWLREGAVFAVLLAAAVLVFWPALDAFFVQDDFRNLLWAQQADARAMAGAFARLHEGTYRPLVRLYFVAMTRWVGLEPAAFHGVSVALLAVNAWLVRRLGRGLGLGLTGSLAAGLFYGCHTAFLTLAMWASATNSLLAVCGALVTVLLVQRRAAWWTRGLATVTSALALCAREVAVMAPLLAWLVLWLPARPWRRGRRACWQAGVASAAATAPLWLLAALYLLARAAGLARLAGTPDYAVGLGPRTLFNAAVLAFHATGLSVRAQELIGAPLGVACRITFWGALLAGAWLARRRGSAAGLVGLPWFGAGILPVIGLTAHWMDAYYLDLALVGPALAAGALLERGMHRLAPPRTPGARGIVGLVLTGLVLASAASVRAELPRALLYHRARLAAALLADVQEAYPRLPPGATLVLTGLDDAAAWAIGFGDLYRVLYGDPMLRVVLARPGDPLPPAAGPAGRVIAFAWRNGELVPVAQDVLRPAEYGPAEYVLRPA